jgi:hypothetical protein
MYCKSCREPVPLDSKFSLHGGAQITGQDENGPVAKPVENPFGRQYRDYVLPFNQKVRYIKLRQQHPSD